MKTVSRTSAVAPVARRDCHHFAGHSLRPLCSAKLAQKFAGSATGRIGGKGTVRRKRKTVHKVAAQDDKKLQATLKRLGVNNIPGIEEVRAGTKLHGRDKNALITG